MHCNKHDKKDPSICIECDDETYWNGVACLHCELKIEACETCDQEGKKCKTCKKGWDLINNQCFTDHCAIINEITNKCKVCDDGYHKIWD